MFRPRPVCRKTLLPLGLVVLLMLIAFGVVLDLTSPSGIGGETVMSWGSAFAFTGLVVTLGPLALVLLGLSPVSSTTRIDADRRE